MILVNNPGSGSDGSRFAPLIHSSWHGCTVADLIFPFFVFITGLATSISLTKRQSQASSLLPLYTHILRRTGILFFLGLFGWFAFGWICQSICPPADTQKSVWEIFFSSPQDSHAYFYSLDNLRLPGVLQRLALVYLGVAVFNLHTGWRVQSLAAAALLCFHWVLMTLPGFSLEPGADFGAWLDRALFGEAHLYQQTWDPEGLCGTLPAIATGLIGGLTGQWLITQREDRFKLAVLFLSGILSLLFGCLWSFVFPLNKNLWTSSFALYSTGWALIILGFLYWLFDCHKARPVCLRPLLRLGQNSLLAYCLSQVGVMALDLMYLGTPSHHSNFLTLIHTALFGESWNVLGLTPWPDPRWPSLYWALLCLLSWTTVIGLVPRQLNFPKVFSWRPAAPSLPVMEINS
jgi:predicted acyltransferase